MRRCRRTSSIRFIPTPEKWPDLRAPETKSRRRDIAIVVTAMQLGTTSFTLDGEAVVCGPDGVAIFDALHRRCPVSEAMLYAFDLLELDGEDLRDMPLGDRKKRLARLPGRRRIGIVLSEHTEEDGPLLFIHAC
jgi:bifunctional non-homologous end joining protein LigD